MNKPLRGGFFFGSVIGSRACTVRISYFGIHFTLDLKARSESLQREGKVPTLLAAGTEGCATLRAAPEGMARGRWRWRGLEMHPNTCTGHPSVSLWLTSVFKLKHL